MRSTPLQRLYSVPKPLIAVTYLAGYVLLDAISFVEPFAPFGITPWNPPTGLSFVLILLFGRSFLPLLFAAPLLTDILVRDTPLPLDFDILTSALVGLGYSAALLFLLRPALRFDPLLSSIRDVVLLTAFAIVSSLIVATCYVGVLVAGGFIAEDGFMAAAARFWIGDMIGIVVFAPFGLIVLTRPIVAQTSLETVFQVLAILAALALVFIDATDTELGFFYPLFLPLIWIAMRTGLEGMAVSVLLTQLGLIFGSQYFAPHSVNLTSFQVLMLVLAITGLFAGALVSEQNKAALQLRLHQESLARLARVGSMGEFAAAMAHEINQPLMAAGTYTRLIDSALESGEGTAAEMSDNARRAIEQFDRAAAVVHRLRALMRLEPNERGPRSVADIIGKAVQISQPELARGGVRVKTSIPNGLPLVEADVLQIEQVLLNLIRNAIEARPGGGGTIEIEAGPTSDGYVEISVGDDGPGFRPELLNAPILPFISEKLDGLGIGLSLCRSIIESHGGTLRLRNSTRGAVVDFRLPVSAEAQRG